MKATTIIAGDHADWHKSSQDVVCIYCRKSSISSVKRAHIVPEGFIENSVTLPIGVECDSCNEKASKLEQAFIHHNRIWVPIMLLGVPGKKGHVRKRLGYFQRDTESNNLSASYKSEWVKRSPQEHKVHAPTPPEFNESKFRRCLAHISLNYLAWKYGPHFVLDNRFDPIRNYVKNGWRNKDWPYGQVSFDDNLPRKALGIGIEEAAPGLCIRIISFLDDFYINPLNEPGLEKYLSSLEGKEVLFFKEKSI